jgi:hypothetical protein
MTLTRCALGAHEVHSGYRSDGAAPRTELLPRPIVRALGKQVEVEVREHRSELIGIDDFAHIAAFVDAQVVAQRLERSVPGHEGGEQPVRVAPLHGNLDVAHDQIDGRGGELQRSDDGAGGAARFGGMAAEHRERIVAQPFGHGAERSGFGAPCRAHR